MAAAENELNAALDVATLEASGWVEREINDEDERPYWIDLPTATQSTYSEWQPNAVTSAVALSAAALGVPVVGHDLASPAAIEHFERIWAGQAPGFDEGQLRAKLNEMRDLLAGLYAHRVQPRSIVGSSVKPSARRDAAVAWLTREITQLENDIATRGRTNAVNNSNVRIALNMARES